MSLQGDGPASRIQTPPGALRRSHQLLRLCVIYNDLSVETDNDPFALDCQMNLEPLRLVHRRFVQVYHGVKASGLALLGRRAVELDLIAVGQVVKLVTNSEISVEEDTRVRARLAARHGLQFEVLEALEPIGFLSDIEQMRAVLYRPGANDPVHDRKRFRVHIGFPAFQALAIEKTSPLLLAARGMGREHNGE